jgi:BA14K-like protein
MQETSMRNVGLMAAAALVAASLPLMTIGASAQVKTPGGIVGGGGGAAAAPRGGGAIGGGGAFVGGGGGGFRGGAPGGGAAFTGPKAAGVIGGPAAGGGFRGGPVAGPRVGTVPQTSWTARPGWTGPWAGNNWRHRHHHHRRFIGTGIGFGLGYGLGAYAASPYYYDYYDDPYYYGAPYQESYVVGGTGSAEDVAYCQRRYRSYDVRTGTFLGKDGRRHPCPAS